jgi:hypothetical protein
MLTQKFYSSTTYSSICSDGSSCGRVFVRRIIIEMDQMGDIDKKKNKALAILKEHQTRSALQWLMLYSFFYLYLPFDPSL